MKKLLILFFMFACIGLQAQFSPTYDTVRFGGTGGKLWQVITYGVGDSIQINGIKYYTFSLPSESDPVWAGDSARYLMKTTADTTYEPIIPAETYMTKIDGDTITGPKTFNEGTLYINNADANGVTLLTTLSGEYGDQIVQFPNKSGIVALTSNLYKMERYSAYSSGANNVEVLADSLGVTATVSTNVITFSIPAGVKLISAKIRFTGYSNIAFHMGTDDMDNSDATDRWMPIVQSWREDTGQQLTGMTTTMDLTYFDKFVINGLISTTNNHIRIDF